MIDPAHPNEFVLERLWFWFQGELFTGRGLLKWSPEDGLQLDGFVDKEIPRCPGFDTSGKTIIEQSKDASTVWMKVRGVGRAIAPNVFPHTLMSLLHEGRLSFKPEKVIFFRETHFVSEKNSWTGSAVFSIADDLHFPDSLKRETFLNGRSIGWQSEGGLSYEEPGGFALTGTPLDKKAFSLNWSLPAIVWSKTDCWNWAEAARRALSIVFGQMIWIVKLDVGRGGKEILQLAKKKSPKKLSHPYQPMVERAIISRGATGKWQFNKDSFIQLTKFFVRKNQNTEICWSIFRRLHEVSEQETWESQELLMATTLEAALRTLDNHPFKGGDYSWKVRQSLSSFQNQYLGGKWDVACKEVLQIRDRLRNRNAHPDWLTHPDGSFSSEEWQQSIQDITFLSRFYGYMILALAGFKDLEPLFPNVQFLKKAEKQ